MVRKMLALSPSDRARALPRLIRFVLAVLIPSLLLWLAYAAVWAAVASLPLEATRALVAGFLLATCGVISTQVTAMGMRYLAWRRRLGSIRHLLTLFWVLLASTCWWYGMHLVLGLAGVLQALGARSTLAQAWLNVPLAAGIHYASYASRRLLAPRIPLDRVSWRTAFAFQTHPKALSVRDPGETFEIVDGLDAVHDAYASSVEQGNQALARLRHDLCLSSDPRFHLPMPLPVAVDFLRQELEMRRASGDWVGTFEIEPTESFPDDMVLEPAVLHALGIFAAEYAQYHDHQDVALRVRFKKSPLPCVEIGTSAKGGDLWFVVAESSAAQGAKDLLVDTLNRVSSREVLYESGQDEDGNLVFRVFARSRDLSEVSWDDIEQRLGQDTQLLATCVLSEGSNRVYSSGNRIHKVQLVNRASPKPLALAEEHNILRRLEGIEGVPQSPSYTEYANFTVLSYDRIDGQRLPDYLSARDFERSAWFHCLSEISSLLNRIHKRGVVHRDLRPANVLVSDTGRVGLIDFDQAVAGAYDAQQVDVTGQRQGIIPSCVSIPQLIDMLGLRDEYQSVADQLEEAWKQAARSDASSPGRSIAYYRWLFGEMELPGERDWFSRWDLMQKALRDVLPGARVLDLGCNLGLVAVHCMLGGARSVTAIDVHDDILEAARKLAHAAGVKVDFVKGDLNATDFVTWLLEREYDVVLALSVTHWIEDRDQAARILRVAPVLLYEGHSPASEEAALLRQLGFSRIRLVGYSERLRALYVASRDEHNREQSP